MLKIEMIRVASQMESEFSAILTSEHQINRIEMSAVVERGEDE
jgi:hypothetical protein